MEKMEQTGQQDEGRIEKIVTHEGIFHTDEVFGEAILKDLFPESMELKAGGKTDFVEYIRTRDKNVIDKAKQSSTTMVIDTGGEDDFEKFNLDHHQLEGAGSRENGVNYATAGLVWKHFGKEWIKYVDVYSRHSTEDKGVIGDKDWMKHIDQDAKDMSLTEEEIGLVWKLIDEQYIQYIDANDTGQMEDITCTLSDGTEMNGKTFSLAEVVRLYNIDTKDGKTHQDRFDSAVEVMRNAIHAAVHKYMDLVEDLRIFKMERCEFISDNKAVLVKQNISPIAMSYLMDNKEEFKEVEYYAALNNKGGYSVMVVPIKEGLRQYRNPDMIPVELRLGNNPKEINKIIGIQDGVTFAHTAGFFASCKNIEASKRFLEYCTK